MSCEHYLSDLDYGRQTYPSNIFFILTHAVLFLHSGQSVASDASPVELWQQRVKVRLMAFMTISVIALQQGLID